MRLLLSLTIAFFAINTHFISAKSSGKSYSDYYKLRKGNSAQKKLFGQWIDVPKGESKDPYNSDVVDAVFKEIKEASNVGFLGVVKIKKLRVEPFTDSDARRSIRYSADIVKSYIPRDKKGKIEFDLVLETDETFNAENGSEIVILLSDEGHRYTLDQFMVFPVQWRMTRYLDRMGIKKSIQDLLKEELSSGYSREDLGSGKVVPTHSIDAKYADSLFVYIDMMLEKSGYDFPSKRSFKRRVDNIFGIDLTQEIQVNTNQCTIDNDSKTKFTSRTIDQDRVIFLRDRKFIAFAYRLPMLIDYKNDYNMSSTTVPSKDIYTDDKNQTFIITTWQDIYNKNQFTNKMESIIKINKYLFNREKKHLDWLVENEPDFMEDLITKYDYTKDKKLFNKILENRETNDTISLDGLIYFKSCKARSASRAKSRKKRQREAEKRFHIYKQTFRYISSKLDDNKYDSIDDNKYLKELDRISKDIYANSGLFVAQKDKVKNHIDKFIKRYIKPPAIIQVDDDLPIDTDE